MGPPKIEVIVSGARPPAWQRWLLDELRSDDRSRVVRVTIASPGQVPRLWRALDAIDRWRERRGRGALDRAGRAVDPKDDGEAVDLRLDLAGRSAEVSVETWRLRVAGDERYGLDAAPLGPLATADGMLRVLVTSAGIGCASLVAEATAPLDRGSPAADLDAALWKGARLVAYAVRDLARGALVRRPLPPLAPAAPPRACVIAGALPRVVAAGLSHKAHDISTRREWAIGVRRKRWRTLRERAGDGWRILRAPPGTSWADPFLARHAGHRYLFFEEIDPTRRGSIRCGELNDDLSLGPTRPIALGGGGHLSYPYVFSNDGQMYLVPETAARRTVELWRAIDPPWRWELEATLLSDVRAADSTLIHHDGRWWLFTAIAAPHATDREELSVFWSDGLDGPWQPHDGDPVITDARWARPAGRPFVDAGRLIRPAQDCSLSYGRRIVLREVEVLTTSDYRERTIGTIGPEWARGSIAAHTFDHDDALEVLDGRWVRRDAAFRFPRRAWRRSGTRAGSGVVRS